MRMRSAAAVFVWRVECGRSVVEVWWKCGGSAVGVGRASAYRCGLLASGCGGEE